MVKKFSIVFILIILAGIIFLTPKIQAVDCAVSSTILTQTDKNACQNELDNLLREQADLETKLKDQNKQTGTLKGDVNALTTQINALKTKIKARANVIAQLKNSIKEKVSIIGTLNDKISREHESLAQLLRNTNDFDNQDFIYLIFSNESLSNFYSDLESYTSIKQAIKASVDQINGVKTKTEIVKKDLENKQNAETDAKAELESTQKKVAKTEAEKKQLLAISKQKESAYQLLVAQKKAKADKIRSALFSLAGISQKIEFGTALQYANDAKQKTGIDPAFLLAILTQESNLGSNVGKCYLSDKESGYGYSKTTGKVWKNLMKPTRDLAPFLEITGQLNLDPLATPVSCPIAGVSGYGGAMGPAQFIPSTWKLFEDRLKDIVGHYANPWSPQDAFIASSLYLTDLGAVGTSTSAQNRAACKYYGSGGSTCSYSKSVQKLKATIQNNIDLLSS